jgi:imidazolonepropionase-like amidohydrolase
MFGTEADTLEQVVGAIRRQVKAGADWIKIMSTGGRFTPRSNPRVAQYPLETLRAAVQDAERLGVRVAAHCHGAEGVRDSVIAGVTNLVHATWLSADPSQGYDYDPAVADMMAEKGLYVDPTIATGHLRELRNPGWMRSHHPDMPADPERRYEILRDMRGRGVKFVTGLDSGMNYVRFNDYAYVPQLMVEEMGMSPMEALVAATRTSAECLGVLDDTGTLEVGKLADVAVVNGDPLADIRAMHSVNAVLKQGELVKRDGVLLV